MIDTYTGDRQPHQTLTKRPLRADTDRRLAAIVADGVSEASAAEMTERELRDVKAVVKASTATGHTPSKKAATSDPGAEPATA